VLHKDWACTDIDTDQPTGLGRNRARTNIGGVISANSASFPVNLQLNLIENSILMTTRTTYILWHTLLPVFHFPSLVSAASEWREHGILECDTTTHVHIILPHSANLEQAINGKSNWDNQYHQGGSLEFSY